MHRRLLLVALFTIGALIGSACGGSAEFGSGATAGDDGAATGSDDGGGDDANDAPSSSGPISGPLYTTGSFGLGLFAIDAATGDVRELESDVVEFVDRNSNPVVTETAAFTIGATTRPDTEFSNDLKLVRLDLATGELTALADLGFDRENDDATSSNFYDLVGAGGNAVVVAVRDGESGETTWRHYDATTGAEVASFPEPTYEFEDESGSCSGGTNALNTVVTTDGRIVTFIDGLPGEIDPMTGSIDALPAGRSCGDFDLSMADFVSPADMDAFSSYRDEVPVEWAGLDTFYWPEMSGGFAVNNQFIEGDGDFWWVFTGSQNTEGFEELTTASALVSGVVQWDPDTESVVQVIPLGAYAGEYLGETDGVVEITRPSFDLAFADGRLILVDTREDAPTLVLDPATGSIAEIAYELGDGIDFVEAELQPTEAGAVWVRVRRAVITSEEDGGRSSTGQFYSERIDPASATVTASYAWAGF